MQIFYVPKSKKNDNLGKNITSKPPSWGQGLTKKYIIENGRAYQETNYSGTP